ncbi:MAG: Na+/Ca+ antiporter, CaCA family [Candidatus Roizmanbacteria bacterium GW2011_GWC2_37_13]|uniref:Na+/Ca+ antiporter, CaCA family n=1 Tax=Candidatus Roizmanbacteria bacterium GW2011_GWC2_37_13 TaxID=1618486 RepID=A0A0G0JAB5_9BACT|nr:MAG: Na+/Ca+ antiporter, CaCA family [Candidatus Roizmanbacteria bacterium GW2011_GWC1_37_12]KKQ25136.1 MAG: Na+/Ca+ antiporter, CaCA family [Candidatus Roizmanbacteria bacterium GW2011_GWC2_37_13]
MIFFQVFFYFVSFLILWYCSGVIITSVERFAQKLKLSAFTVSFFILGILTSVPEFSVGINSIIDKTPDVFVGNLIGASLTLFIFVIPILAVFGKGVKMTHQMTEHDMIFALLVVAAPIFLIADNVLTRTESVFLILIYIILVYFIEKKKALVTAIKEMKHLGEKSMLINWLELILAVVIIFLTSRFIVNQTIYFSDYFHLSSFIISIVFLSIGTNLPEISLAVRSVIEGKKEVALGDYLGSAAANTLLFGILTFINGDRINVSNYSLRTLILTLFGLGVFYVFSQSKKEISQKEGKVLLLIYLLFIITQILFP